MRAKSLLLSNFAHNTSVPSRCFRPDTETQLYDIAAAVSEEGMLVRGNGLSYNDSALLEQGYTVLSERLNHFICFNPDSGIVICQSGLAIKDLFTLDARWMPAVVPGTVNVTVGGAIAHDVHGKNHHQQGTFSDHVLWIELLTHNQVLHINPNTHPQWWKATIAGCGLSGVILRAAIQLIPKTQGVSVVCRPFSSFCDLLSCMQSEGLAQDYQAAWVDLINGQNAVLSMANHNHRSPESFDFSQWSLPKLPFNSVQRPLMRRLNTYYFQRANKGAQACHFIQFNNPLDRLKNWARLYGPKGLLQFQCTINRNNAHGILEAIQSIVNQHRALPCLSVLKYFDSTGAGYLSFTKKGFTLAIDFSNNAASQKAIQALNAYIIEIKEQVYLAKDSQLNQAQFEAMYPKHQAFKAVLQSIGANMRSDLGKRLGLHL